MQRVGLALAVVALACSTPPDQRACTSSQEPSNTLLFHGDRARSGWYDREADLAPVRVASAAFGALWTSPPLDDAVVGDRTYAPHLYASPLYVDDLTLQGGAFDGLRTAVILAASSNGWVYAIRAGRARCGGGPAPGTPLWRTQLGAPVPVPGLDGGVPLGVLSTPAIDLSAAPPRLYVTSTVADVGWQVFALELASGRVLPGWPLTIDDGALAPINRNGPARFQPATAMSQRGALDLSPDGGLLYLPFGAYADGGTGWIVAVDTHTPRLEAAFAAAPFLDAAPNGGIWGSGGAAVGDDGSVYVTTGNSPEHSEDAPNTWGNSFLRFSPELDLLGTYTPWNYCQLDLYDTDLGGGSPLLLPDLGAAMTSTPQTVSFGGKQGNAYLVDLNHLPGALDRRQPCSTDPTSDRSLLGPDPQPQFGTRGPLNVFGPYSERFAHIDNAKMRTTPAAFRDADGTQFLFYAGSTKASVSSIVDVVPSLARLRVVRTAGQAAWLAPDATDHELVFWNPGSPVVTSLHGTQPVVWVLDPNALRTASLLDPATPKPVFYAVDGQTMQLLWRTAEGELELSGKYNSPAVAHGVVYIGTDRIHAFGVTDAK
jgi:hypothetical protein